jgi:alpha-beta hydrolase superfamily lysophospholipase
MTKLNEAAMTRAAEETIAGTGGELFLRSWRPNAAPRTVVAICHGFNAHSGYYQWAADQFTAKGLTVYAVDLRGRGRSDGERFYVETVDDYVADVDAMIATARARDAGRKVFLLGHSAGGVVSVTYALDHGSQIAGLICADFAYQVPAPDFAIAALKGLAHVVPHSKAFTLKNADFSRDSARIAAMNADPLIAGETQPFQTMSALAHADERLKRSFSQVKVPVFIVHGAADRVTKPSGSREFYEHAGSADKTLRIYEDRFHDMLNDFGREEVMADFQAWIDARI